MPPGSPGSTGLRLQAALAQSTSTDKVRMANMQRGRNGDGEFPGAPRWVKVFGIVGVLLLLLFLILHLTGGGLGSH